MAHDKGHYSGGRGGGRDTVDRERHTGNEGGSQVTERIIKMEIRHMKPSTNHNAVCLYIYASAKMCV